VTDRKGPSMGGRRGIYKLGYIVNVVENEINKPKWSRYRVHVYTYV